MIVKHANTLLPYLLAELKHSTRNEIKRYLKFHSVSVNGLIASRHDHPLYPGDRISVQTDIKKVSQRDFLKSRLDVVYEDASIILIHKPAGLLTIATEKIQKDTAIHQVMQYLKLARQTADKKNRPQSRHEGRFARAASSGLNRSAPASRREVFVVHRLDREVSGLLLLAKTYEAKQSLQTHWKDAEKKYYAAVEGVPAQESGTLQSYLKENKHLNMYSTGKSDDAKLSITHYKVLKKSDAHSLLEIRLETGRKHQIRVHLSELGHPIVGDDRYGAQTNPIGRLALHSYYLSFPHPKTGKRMTFTLPIPPAFNRLFQPGRESA